MKLSDKQKALDTIATQIENCKICKQNAIGKSVPGAGNPDADIVFLGEAPGKQEAETGLPFIGRAGKVLRTFIADTGLRDKDVFITSPVKYLPTYVTPTLEDVTHGRTHLNAQLAIIQPKIIVLMGRIAALAMLNRNIQVAKEHGTIIEQDGRKYLLMYHPAAPLYNPKVKVKLQNDFKILKGLISG